MYGTSSRVVLLLVSKQRVIETEEEEFSARERKLEGKVQYFSLVLEKLQ